LGVRIGRIKLTSWIESMLKIYVSEDREVLACRVKKHLISMILKRVSALIGRPAYFSLTPMLLHTQFGNGKLMSFPVNQCDTGQCSNADDATPLRQSRSTRDGTDPCHWRRSSQKPIFYRSRSKPLAQLEVPPKHLYEDTALAVIASSSQVSPE
jgi:hypothetical protein